MRSVHVRILFGSGLERFEGGDERVGEVGTFDRDVTLVTALARAAAPPAEAIGSFLEGGRVLMTSTYDAGTTPSCPPARHFHHSSWESSKISTI